MIRVATQEDAPVLRELIDALIKESVYFKLFAGYKLSDDMIATYTNSNTLLEKICVLTLDDENTVTGIGVFDTVPWLYNDAPIKLARLAYIYIKPAFRGLGHKQDIENAFEHWGKRAGCSYLSQGISKDNTELKEEMKNNGYIQFEVIYMKEVK